MSSPRVRQFLSPMGLKMRLNSCLPQACDDFVSPKGLKMRLNLCYPQGCDIFVSPMGLIPLGPWTEDEAMLIRT